LAPILTHLPKVSGICFKDSDIHINYHAEKAAFVRVQMETINLMVWDVTKKRDKSQKTIQAIPKNQGIKKLTKWLDGFIDALNENQPTTLPVFVYYDTNRVVPDTIVLKHQVHKDLSRFKALNNALQPNTQVKEALEWFYAIDIAEK
jgi:cobalamin biosynthesis Mg chelatase CobN